MHRRVGIYKAIPHGLDDDDFVEQLTFVMLDIENAIIAEYMESLFGITDQDKAFLGY
jgi:hypothetical protein